MELTVHYFTYPAYYLVILNDRNTVNDIFYAVDFKYFTDIVHTCI